MKYVSHIEKRGKWARSFGNRVCFACKAESDRAKPMPTQWADHIVDGQHVFTCSTLCRLQKGLKA